MGRNERSCSVRHGWWLCRRWHQSDISCGNRTVSSSHKMKLIMNRLLRQHNRNCRLPCVDGLRRLMDEWNDVVCNVSLCIFFFVNVAIFNLITSNQLSTFWNKRNLQMSQVTELNYRSLSSNNVRLLFFTVAMAVRANDRMWAQKLMRTSMFLRQFICHTRGFHCAKFKKIATVGSIIVLIPFNERVFSTMSVFFQSHPSPKVKAAMHKSDKWRTDRYIRWQYVFPFHSVTSSS